MSECTQEFIKIGDITEQNNIAIKGVISKLQDVRTFTRKSDGSEGKLRNFDVSDDTGSIRTTIWGNDTDILLTKGDIVKIIGADARFDDYTDSGYSLNTNFNTQLSINPENLSDEELDIFDEIKQKVSQIKRLSEVEEFDEDGIEVDVIGRMFAIFSGIVTGIVLPLVRQRLGGWSTTVIVLSLLSCVMMIFLGRFLIE